VSLVIGVDFDNTIACYDQVFCKVAQTLGLLECDFSLSKSQVKQSLLESAAGDLSWQKLQGQVYGKYMHLATMYPGFMEFLFLAKLQGHKVVIVSHKSEFGHFDEKKIPLRQAATEWMQDSNIEGLDTLELNREDIFFASTRELKIVKIRELKCDYFIDDLVEVLDEPLFPNNTKKILFDPHQKQMSTDDRLSITSWRQITKQLLEGWNEFNIVTVANKAFPKLNIETSSIIKGRGNSRIYRLNGKKGDYALKIYPDRQLDSRNRLETEYSACCYLASAGFPVMQVQDKSQQLDWAVYQWVSGQEIQPVDNRFINEAVSFIKALNENSQNFPNRAEFNKASEACLSGQDIVEQINSRLERLKRSNSKELRLYLNKEFISVFESIIEKIKTHSKNLFNTQLSEELQILSPSDFGSHNAIRSDSDETIFIDFEYFGWDDPVKLVSDFYWHPGVSLSALDRVKWIDATSEIFKADSTYEMRLSAYLPLYALRWCLIILNEFLPERLINRLNASNQDDSNVKKILDSQLNKSKTLLNQVIEDIPYYGSALQRS
jgi:hypothetical protein